MSESAAFVASSENTGKNPRFSAKTELEPTGIEPATSWLQTSGPSQKSVNSDVKMKVSAGVFAPGYAPIPDDPRLAALIQSWADLPEGVKDGFAATAQALIR